MSTATDPLSQLVKAAVVAALNESGKPLRNRLMTREQAADYLSVEPSTIDRLYHLDKIRRVALTERVFRYDVADLDRYVEESK